MIAIAGGAYVEKCEEPQWEELFGSGVRAAASLSDFPTEIKLSTYIGQGDLLLLKAISGNYGFSICPTEITQTLGFYYTHGFSTPIISPHPLQLEKAPNILIEDRNILRMGMLEGEAVVHGESVVYDPQSTYDAKPFGENGSSAERLAIVANFREAVALSGSYSLDGIVRSLLSGDNVEAVIIKQGSKGALVATHKTKEHIPVYETDFVWPLGSGDVFSAHFAFRWAVEGRDAVDAADMASKAAAFYCNNSVMPIPRNFAKNFQFKALEPGATLPLKEVYLAGPFFNMSQRWLINESRQNLKGMGLKVFSPFHDVGVGSSGEIYGPDIAALDRCDVVFACLDGLDSGTLFEVGYAIAQGTPVVVFVQSESEGDMKMIDGSPCCVCNDFCTAIYKTAWIASRR